MTIARSSFDQWLARLRGHRTLVVLAVDLLSMALAWQVTYLFRLGFERWISARPSYDAWVLLGLLVIYAIAFMLTGVPKGMWRFAGFGEVKRLTLAVAMAGAVGGLIIWLSGLQEVPRAVLALHPVVALMALTMNRIVYRMVYEHVRSRSVLQGVPPRRALVMGAGDAAKMLMAGIQHQGWEVQVCLDDDPLKHGTRIGAVPVKAGLDAVQTAVDIHDVTHIIIAMPSATIQQRRRAFELAARTHLPVLTVPNADELHPGRTITSIRDVQPEDLLGREPVQLDEVGIGETLRDKVVLITGAGGSIGSELCRQVARYAPASLVLFELSEFNLYAIEQSLSDGFPGLQIHPLLGDVKDPVQVQQVFERFEPQVVFHAAAFKHVPLTESNDNAWMALRNNVQGTQWVALSAAAGGAERFVLVSTDKAVRPTNVMGASKRAAEMVVSHLATQGHATQFMAVRFGNVLGSSGSVIPKFKEQIARGGPVTVTHLEVTRYFMTIPEAARLVIQAAAIGSTGQVLVLDMGEPVKIIDLARQLIQLAGHRVEEIPIVVSGLRPGEKLYEELLADADATTPTTIERLRIATLEIQSVQIESLLAWMQAQSVPPDADLVKEQLRLVVSDYFHKL